MELILRDQQMNVTRAWAIATFKSSVNFSIDPGMKFLEINAFCDDVFRVACGCKATIALLDFEDKTHDLR